MKKMVLFLAVLFFNNFMYGQNVMVQTIGGGTSETRDDCAYRVNGICITEDIGGVTVEAIKWNNDANSAQVIFTNYNNSVVTVVYEITSSKGVIQGYPDRTDTEKGTVVLRKDESKAVNIQGGHNISTRLVVRNLQQSQTQTQSQSQTQLQPQLQIKMAYVYTSDVMQAMPEYIEAQNALQRFANQLQNELEAMNTEFTKKYEAYMREMDNLTEAVKVRRMKEVSDLNDSVSQYRESAQKQIEERKNNLNNSITEKIMRAIQAVGDENGFSSISDANNFYYKSGLIDVTQLVKRKLGMY